MSSVAVRALLSVNEEQLIDLTKAQVVLEFPWDPFGEQLNYM